MNALIALAALAVLGADEYAAEPLKEAAPAEVAQAVRQELAPAGLRVLRNKQPLLDLWLRAAAPLGPPKEELGVHFSVLAQGTLVGAVRVHGGASDFRAQKYAAGVYTLRYGLQPEDGDHQGTAESRDFLVLAPASADPSPRTMPLEDVVKLSTKVSGKKHPAVLWLAKPQDALKPPRVVRDDQHDRWLLDCELGAGDGKTLRMWIVVVGKAAE